MSASVDLFVEDARAVSVADVVDRLGLGSLRRAGTAERIGPCPACGGRDRFSVNTAKNAWNCRGAAVGGKDAIGLAAHINGLHVDRREDFLAACSIVTGMPVPDGQGESEDRRREREAELAERRRLSEAAAERQAEEQNAYRDRERARARAKWTGGFRDAVSVRTYLGGRLGRRDLPVLPFLREAEREPYWHGQDEAGRTMALHTGAAMVAPFVDPSGAIIGCHLTWLDTRGPKGRPVLRDENGEVLPTKKMRGTSKGGLIPLVGFDERDGLILPDAKRSRLVVGEGIETVLAVALAEGVQADTIYASAGSLGNLAGPADPDSSYLHPTLKKEDARGRARAVRVPGPLPKPDQEPGDAFQAPAWVTEIVLLADGDSEREMTGAAMARARRRLGGKRRVAIAWPPPGMDFADLFCGASKAA